MKTRKEETAEHKAARQAGDGPEVTGKPKPKKNTRRWCRGKEGQEHTPGLRLSNVAQIWIDRGRPEVVCDISWGRDWCDHQRYCTQCGRIIDYFIPRDQCPDRP